MPRAPALGAVRRANVRKLVEIGGLPVCRMLRDPASRSGDVAVRIHRVGEVIARFSKILIGYLHVERGILHDLGYAISKGRSIIAVPTDDQWYVCNLACRDRLGWLFRKQS